MMEFLGTMVQMALHDPPRELAELCESYYRPYYHLLYLLSRHLEAKGMCVELGVEKGRGCSAMALACSDVVGFDHTRREEIGPLQQRFPNFDFREQPSLPAPELGPIKLLHVDTEHSLAQAREEFNGYRSQLVKGAAVCFDDLHAQNDGVAEFFWSLDCPKIQDDRLHECGYGVAAWL